MVSSAASAATTTAIAPPYSHPQLAQLQTPQGTPLVLPQPTNAAAAAAYGALLNPGKHLYNQRYVIDPFGVYSLSITPVPCTTSCK